MDGTKAPRINMNKFIVTYGDRVVLDYTNNSEGVHRTFDTEIKAMEYILAASGVYFHVDYFELTVGKLGGSSWCRYSDDWTMDEVIQDVYHKFKDSYLQEYKIYAVVS